MAPRRKRVIPFNFNNEDIDKEYWSRLERRSITIGSVHNYHNLLHQRQQYRKTLLTSFRRTYRPSVRRGPPSSPNNILKALQYWVEYQSWTYCQNCSMLTYAKLEPKSLRSKGCKVMSLRQCPCQRTAY